MSDNKQPDPGEAFRNLITEWERGFDAMANRIMGTDEFSRGMNQLQDLQLSMQKRFNEAMAQQLTNLNIPSRDDILRLGESVRMLDKRLAGIEAQLSELKRKKKKNKEGKDDDSGAAASARTGPPRTKKAPSQRAAAKAEAANDG
jgi:hypothetical protein